MKRRMRILMIIAAAGALLWVIGDWIHSAIIAARIRRWEASLQLDSDGVRNGCQEFSLGEGERAILFVHGINDSPACFREMAEALAEALSDDGYVCNLASSGQEAEDERQLNFFSTFPEL